MLCHVGVSVAPSKADIELKLLSGELNIALKGATSVLSESIKLEEKQLSSYII